MNRYRLYSLAGLFITLSLAQSPKVHAQAALQRYSPSTYFIANAGQWDAQVLYLCKLPGLRAWITSEGVVYDFFQTEPLRRSDPEESLNPTALPSYVRKGHVVSLRFLGTQRPIPEGHLRLAGCHNYFLGNDPSRWAKGVPLYQEVVLRELYPGIDVHYSLEGGRLRFDFLVHPHADVTQIRFTLTGAAHERLEAEGHRLTFSTSLGDVSLAELASWQTGQPIESHFVRIGTEYRIALGPYDPALPLLIDPIVYSTFLGGNDWDRGHDVLLAPSGELYITGYTESTNFPTTPGAYQTSDPDGSYFADAFVTKLSPQGNGASDLLYSTYIGGNNADYGYNLTIDDAGNLYLAGATYSTNFPTTSGAYQTTDPDNSDLLSEGFILKLRPQGGGASDLLYSTYIGGDNFDVCRALAIDAAGDIYAAGRTESTNFPTTSGAYQTANLPGPNGFILRLRPQGNGNADLLYSTYLGGAGSDDGRDIALDPNGNIYVVGFTESTDFPTTSNSYQPTPPFGRNGFLIKLRPQGNGSSDLLYSTYLGGAGEDNANTLALDAAGNVYVSGGTTSNDFPTTANSYQPNALAGGEAFLVKLDPQGNGAADLLYSTYLGGSGSDYGYGLAVDADGRAYIVGVTGSTNFPTSSCGSPLADQGGDDLFVAIVSPSGNGVQDLLYATYLGGASTEQQGAFGQGIAIDLAGRVYVTGRTLSTDFPTTAGAYQPTYPTELMGGNAFLTLLDASACLPNTAVPSPAEATLNTLQAFPNPSEGEFWLYSPEGGTVELRDVTGRLLRTYELPAGKALPCREPLARGVYLLRHTQTATAVRLRIE